MTEQAALPSEPAFFADPFPLYEALRAGGRVRRVLLPGGLTVWLIGRYEDVVAAFSDPRLSSDLHHAADQHLARLIADSPSTDLFARNMLRADPPDHTRLRRLVAKAFTPRRVENLRPRVQQITDDLLDRIAPRGRADLIEAFALPLPVTVICELLGVPIQDRYAFREWIDVMLDRPLGAVTHTRELKAARARMRAYLVDLLAAKRARPGDDLLSALIAARDEDGRLDEEELVAMAFLLLAAGYITTVNLIGNGVLALLRDPGQLRRLRDEPDLLPSAVDELLRYDGPVNPGVTRFAAEDIEIDGVVIPRGEVVLLATAAADRDAERFADPDRLDLARDDNPHLAFGHGVHYCLGAPLARLEGQVAIGTLLHRFPDLALAGRPEELRWRTGFLRGLQGLPVTFTPN